MGALEFNSFCSGGGDDELNALAMRYICVGMPYDAMHTDPTEAMLRWQAMTSLAYGSSGVMYFW